MDLKLNIRQNFDSYVHNRLDALFSFSSAEKIMFWFLPIEYRQYEFQEKVDNIEFVKPALDTGDILRNYQTPSSDFPCILLKQKAKCLTTHSDRSLAAAVECSLST